MIPLVRLKRDVQFNADLTNVVNVLKGIAAARFHTLERQLKSFDRYFKSTEDILSAVDLRQAAHPFVQAKSQRVGVVMVTSDAGFLGGLNSQVVSAGLHQAGAGLLTVIGERGANYLRELRREATRFPGIEDQSRLNLAVAVRDHVVRQVLDGQCGPLIVAYPKPVSFALQKVTVESLLPCGQWVPKAAPFAADALWESRPEEVVDYVVQEWLAHRLNLIFALSRLAELAARFVHLEGSYQELLHRGKKLKHEYFRARHELIDRSMREIFAAQLLSQHAAEG